MLSCFLSSQLSSNLFSLVCLLSSPLLSHFLIPLISSSFSLCSHFLFKPIIPSVPFPLLLFPCFISFFQFFFPSSHLTTSLVSLPCSSCLPSSFSSCLLPYPLLLLLHSSFHPCPVLSPLLFFPCFLLSPLILQPYLPTVTCCFADGFLC